MDAAPWEPSNSDTILAPAGANLESLTDRLRQVRRQLSRGKPLAQVLDHPRHSVAALRAAQRLESAVRRLSEVPTELPWLVHVVEKRATALEGALNAESSHDSENA